MSMMAKVTYVNAYVWDADACNSRVQNCFADKMQRMAQFV
jgi:hypothetical protein